MSAVQNMTMAINGLYTDLYNVAMPVGGLSSCREKWLKTT